jgi:DNA-binding transcriptional LysR family regulator
MYLYCAPRHPLFAASATQHPADWDALRAHAFAGLGYHSPNMEISQQVQLTRSATGYDQEAIATLILSGYFLGFLPDHYAQSFVQSGQMRAVNPRVFNYRCSFFCIVRATPQAARVTQAFRSALLQHHAY